MDFLFNASAGTMSLYIFLYQGTDGPYLAQIVYRSTVDVSGNYKFTRAAQNGNAELIVTDMSALLGPLESDQFRMDAFATSYSLLGQFTSRQTPSFYFSGYLY